MQSVKNNYIFVTQYKTCTLKAIRTNLSGLCCSSLLFSTEHAELRKNAFYIQMNVKSDCYSTCWKWNQLLCGIKYLDHISRHMRKISIGHIATKLRFQINHPAYN